MPDVTAWPSFIRELSGRIAQEVQGLRARQKGVRFWKKRPFTRVVQGWGKAYKTAKEYVQLNLLEADGHISRKDTKTLKDLRAIFAHG